MDVQCVGPFSVMLICLAVLGLQVRGSWIAVDCLGFAGSLRADYLAAWLIFSSLAMATMWGIYAALIPLGLQFIAVALSVSNFSDLFPTPSSSGGGMQHSARRAIP